MHMVVLINGASFIFNDGDMGVSGKEFFFSLGYLVVGYVVIFSGILEPIQNLFDRMKTYKSRL